jgi:molybdenum cofactor cytidylyltransferase
VQRAAIVLAAGASQRMGSPKALLPWRGTTLLAYALRTLREASAEPIVVVLGLAHEQIQQQVPELAGTRVVLNLDEASGRSGSIRIGSAALPDDVRRLIVQSVDQPTSADVLRALLDVDAAVVVPMHAGRRGHPVCFSGALVPELREVSEQTEGLRAVVRRHADDVVEVPVEDPSVSWNLNDPRAYAAALDQI